MPKLNTTSVSLAVTPTVVATLFTHYLQREPLKEKPTAHLSYDEGLRLLRAFIEHASHHTIEDLQAFTAQWVPSPQWVKTQTVKIPQEHLSQAAEAINNELGQDGRALVGGSNWWQWRRPKKPLEAEWVEMRTHANERKKTGHALNRVILYCHGGAYFFGSPDEHRYQIQRHARKLKARVLAPRYRLAPQFPFPCGLQDCLAAYLHLLSSQHPNTIILAGDSAGGGMILSMLCILRNQGLPLPAGAILISPWVDLTSSFKSIADEAPMDYIPPMGFHFRPSKAWPPPNDDDIAQLKRDAQKSKPLEPRVTDNPDEKLDTAAEFDHKPDERQYIKLDIDGEQVTVKDQIHLYTTNALLNHPLVSPVLQATLGGLPPIQILTGGGEILKDEQIYLAHKCANPQKYAPPLERMSERDKTLVARFKPTDVQLQVWDHLCHVTPVLSFTKPAKYMYRSIAQFGAWLLARAQKRGIDIVDDDQISIISTSDSEPEADNGHTDDGQETTTQPTADATTGQVGKAGDPLPPFKNHMIRQRVTSHGVTLPLAPEEELQACSHTPAEVGVFQVATAKKWLITRRKYDHRYARLKAKFHKQFMADLAQGSQDFGPGEYPPPTALAGRHKLESHVVESKKRRSYGLSLWSLWGSKHDEDAIEREKQVQGSSATDIIAEGQAGCVSHQDRHGDPTGDAQSTGSSTRRSRSRQRTVVDLNQTEQDGLDENTPVTQLLHQRQDREAARSDLLSPDYVPETGVAGKRPFIKGMALPFSLNKEADTASMLTLTSAASPSIEPSEQRAAGSVENEEHTALLKQDLLADTTSIAPQDAAVV